MPAKAWMFWPATISASAPSVRFMPRPWNPISSIVRFWKVKPPSSVTMPATPAVAWPTVASMRALSKSSRTGSSPVGISSAPPSSWVKSSANSGLLDWLMPTRTSDRLKSMTSPKPLKPMLAASADSAV